LQHIVLRICNGGTGTVIGFSFNPPDGAKVLPRERE
jgi:hypothetical protein